MKKIASRSVFFVLLGAVVMEGCSNKHDASKSNFSAAIQDYLNTKKGACVVLPKKTMPFTLQKTGEWNINHEIERSGALVKAGLLSGKDTQVKPDFGNQLVPGIEYSLTDEGKKYLVSDSGETLGPWPALCRGKLTVTAIDTFTEPSDAMGMKISQVKFSYRVENAPDWAKSADLQAVNPQLKKDMSDSASDKAVLISTSDGWVHENLLKAKGG